MSISDKSDIEMKTMYETILTRYPAAPKTMYNVVTIHITSLKILEQEIVKIIA